MSPERALRRSFSNICPKAAAGVCLAALVDCPGSKVTMKDSSLPSHGGGYVTGEASGTTEYSYDCQSPVSLEGYEQLTAEEFSGEANL